MLQQDVAIRESVKISPGVNITNHYGKVDAAKCSEEALADLKNPNE
jgi:hypothetical protein